ncbi:MAG: hypothetical protein E7523_12690 [Ruminococcaceae bacterium]|nr:hypothetical protein [Oscillospiraceae bacterium]
MKKLLAILMALALVFCFAACGDKTEEEPTRSQEELIAEANEAAEKLVEYKETLDKQLLLVNSADNTDGFFDLAGMAAAGAQLDAVIDLINFDSDELTDGDTSPVDSVASAKQAADQIREISGKVNTAAAKYYAQFATAFPGAEMTKMYCLTVFMSGEPSNFFAADYTDADGNKKTVYSISSFTAETPESVLSTIADYLFAEEPVASRNAVKDGNFNIDMDAVRAAVSGTVTDGNATDGNAAE